MYDIITLPNGLRVVCEPMPAVRSAAVGIWVGAGSRFEKTTEAGYAHFIEHMLFKGTASHSAGELAELMDAVGGQCNAFTTRETTCFYARALDSHLDAAADILEEMFFDSLFAPDDLASERSVVLEEIDMYEDTPEDLVVEQLMARCFPGPLGRPVLGRPTVLHKATGESLRAFMGREYRPERVVVSLSGSYTDAHVDRLCRRFERMPSVRPTAVRESAYAPAFVLRRKSTEQNHLCLAWPGLPVGSDERFTWQILSTVLGDGLSSRLFQTIREKYGLCYSIGSFTASYRETGLFGVSTAVGRDTEERALTLILQEVEKLRQDGISAAELDRARELIKANMVLGMESSAARMNRLGSAVLQMGRCLSVDEVIERYDAVTAEDVLSLARRLLDPAALSFSAVGHLPEEARYRDLLG